jgi:tRNA1Val (adenine37-N6)-methyltransferase
MKSYSPPEIVPGQDERIDSFMEGRLRLIQSRTGYRSSVDAILLAEFVTVKKGEIVADLGTGCGIIPLLLHLTRPIRYAVGLEIQPGLADQTARNIKLNSLDKRMNVILGDIRHPPMKSSSVDVVVCNPPYREKTRGRINHDNERAIARHEILASLKDILTTASLLLKVKGRLAMIYPAERLAVLTAGMKEAGLEPKRVRVIYPGMESDAKLVMVEATLGGRPGLKILPPLLDQGKYSVNRSDQA